MRDVVALVALPTSSATLSSFPTRILTSQKDNSPPGFRDPGGLCRRVRPGEARRKELGFPGAGHWGLLRSRAGTWGVEKVPHPTRDASGKSRRNSRYTERDTVGSWQGAEGSGRLVEWSSGQLGEAERKEQSAERKEQRAAGRRHDRGGNARFCAA